MNTLDRLAQAVLAAFAALAALVLGVLDAIEGALSHAMVQAGIPAPLRTLLFIIVAVLFLVAAVRLFGGLIRVGLILLLAVILIHALFGTRPELARHARVQGGTPVEEAALP